MAWKREPKARIGLLEIGSGFVTLNDGAKFRPKESGIRNLFDATKLRRDLGREPMLADFLGEVQDQWRHCAKWNPDHGKHGQIGFAGKHGNEDCGVN
jgi:hypothetical protein